MSILSLALKYFDFRNQPELFLCFPLTIIWAKGLRVILQNNSLFFMDFVIQMFELSVYWIVSGVADLKDGISIYSCLSSTMCKWLLH